MLTRRVLFSNIKAILVLVIFVYVGGTLITSIGNDRLSSAGHNTNNKIDQNIKVNLEESKDSSKLENSNNAEKVNPDQKVTHNNNKLINKTEMKSLEKEEAKTTSRPKTVKRRRVPRAKYWIHNPQMRNISYIDGANVEDEAEYTQMSTHGRVEVRYPEKEDDQREDDWIPGSLLKKLDEPTTRCRKLRYVGGHMSCGFMDGQKYVCFDPDVAPKTFPNPNIKRWKYYDETYNVRKSCSKPRKNIFGREYCPAENDKYSNYNEKQRLQNDQRCIVYSFGIATDLSFDEKIAQYGCRVYSYDMTIVNSTNGFIRPNLNFVNLGIAVEAHDIQMTMVPSKTEILASVRPIEEILDILDHKESTIDILKVDVENAEWPILDNLLQTDDGKNILSHVNQIALEIHLSGFQNASAAVRVTEGRKYERILDQLSVTGFKLVHTFLNQFSQVYADVRKQVFPLFRESLYIRRP